jgi:NADH dehydrogenase FAD-containing subunit
MDVKGAVLRNLVLVGGGHAHLSTIRDIPLFVERDVAVTVIAPSPFQYYSGMGPGMLGGDYRPEDIRFATREMVERTGGRFVEDLVVGIDAARRRIRLQSGSALAYDLLSCNCGSQVSMEGLADAADTVFTVKPIEQLLSLQDRIVKRGRSHSLHIAIIGGGPSAAEVAGNILWLAATHRLSAVRVSLFCRGQFMARFTRRVQYLCRGMLVRRGVEFFEGRQVEEVRPDGLLTADGRFFQADLLCVATGVHPPLLFRESGLPTGSDGGLLVNVFLQCPQYPEIFGGGDCINFAPSPLARVGVYAVRQNPILSANLLASLTGRELTPFQPGGGYLQIFNLGWQRGVLAKGPFAFSGRLAFLIKDLIDRRFIRRFQGG